MVFNKKNLFWIIPLVIIGIYVGYVNFVNYNNLDDYYLDFCIEKTGRDGSFGADCPEFQVNFNAGNSEGRATMTCLNKYDGYLLGLPEGSRCMQKKDCWIIDEQTINVEGIITYWVDIKCGRFWIPN